ncbi:MAG TPA: hypothetical protein DHV62_10300, partial [Elusimicrobia bacterium]|nr:hypothetical protein [Elusimicrobiota bacterium]
YTDKTFGDKHNIEHYSIIPNGIDINEIQNSTIKFRELYSINTKYMLLNVSNHYKLKGHSFVLKSFKLLNRNDVTLVIIGNKVSGLSGCYSKCKQNVSDNPNIVLLENVPRDHTVSAFHEADVFTFGSKVECFPLVILESMSVGLPYVSTNVGCVKQMGGGIVVNSPMEMTDVVNKLLSNENYRREIGKKGQYECLSQYTWDTIIPKYEKLFQRVTEIRQI